MVSVGSDESAAGRSVPRSGKGDPYLPRSGPIASGRYHIVRWFWLLRDSVRASSIGSSPKGLVHSDYDMWLDPPG